MGAGALGTMAPSNNLSNECDWSRAVVCFKKKKKKFSSLSRSFCLSFKELRKNICFLKRLSISVERGKEK